MSCRAWSRSLPCPSRNSSERRSPGCSVHVDLQCRAGIQRRRRPAPESAACAIAAGFDRSPCRPEERARDSAVYRGRPSRWRTRTRRAGRIPGCRRSSRRSRRSAWSKSGHHVQVLTVARRAEHPLVVGEHAQRRAAPIRSLVERQQRELDRIVGVDEHVELVCDAVRRPARTASARRSAERDTCRLPERRRALASATSTRPIPRRE